ncbi:protein TonB [Rhizobium sp. PP-CC-2G-626]|nr:protein TonB [Rhizobium sp. PP-CC-2G-626]
MKKAAKWALALSVSVAAHAGAAIAFLPDAPPPPFAATQGGEEMQIALLGNAFEDTVESGAISDTITPVETPPDDVAALEPEMTESETPTPTETVSEVVPETVPTEADVILPADAEPPVVAEAPEVVASLPPVATVVPETRPETPPEVAEKPPARKPAPVKKAEVEKPKPVKSGKEGQSEAAANKGREDGSKLATATSAGKGTRASSAGDASFSNFEGKVRNALKRAIRSPSRAESNGVVQVSFVLDAQGNTSGSRVVRSSGSPTLDAAVLDGARRMRSPKIPEASGKSTWAFSISIDFRR